MKSNRGLVQLAPAVLFIVTGAFWAGIVVLGGGIYLTWGAITAVLSGVFLFAAASKWFTRPMAVASCLFGLVLTVFQLYQGIVELGTVLQTVAVYSTGLFALFTVIYLYLLISMFRPAETTEESGKEKKKGGSERGTTTTTTSGS